MGGKDVTIDYDLLEGVRSSLKELIAELEDAPDRNSDIAGAIDSPFEMGELQGAASDFRGAWEPKRTELIDELQDISKYISDVIDSYYGLDRWF